MSLLFIICILFFIVSFCFSFFYLIKGIIKKDFFYIKSSLICFAICIVSIVIPFISIADIITESFSN